MAMRSLLSGISLVVCLLLCAGSAESAVMSISPSAAPPVVNDADIAQYVAGTLLTAPETGDANDANYLFSDRPAQGNRSPPVPIRWAISWMP